MDAALGPPEGMAEHSDELTPMMSQYFEVCSRYEDALVLFHVGDFYKTFCEAAETVARLCELTLTEREDSTGEYPMAGIPIDNAESYIERLLDAGYRVAIAEQVEDPEEVSGVAERAVTRVITPGTLTEDELLKTDDNNYVACLAARTADTGEYGIAVLDVSTGEFFATSVETESTARDELRRFSPAEAIVGPAVPDETAEGAFDADCMVTPYEKPAFDLDAARERVASYFGSPARMLGDDAEIRACGALLAYAEFTRGGEDGRLEYLNRLTRYDPHEYMLLDAVALESLELFEPRSVHGSAGTALVDVIDETSSALGHRRLTAWLRRPLLDRDRIEARLDAVEELVASVRTRGEIRELLAEVYDIERLISRVSRNRANARDLRSLKATLDVVPALREALADVESASLAERRSGLDVLADVRGLIDRAIREDPPTTITDGSVIKPGYNEQLDDLREAERSGKDWIDSLEERERERTGIDSLKVGYNAVHGYYIEVTEANLDRVPDDYTRRQTLKNAERYYTPELKRREDEIIRAEQRADDLEHQLFREVREAVADEAERVQALAETLADLDALAALAEVAAAHDYARPTFSQSGIDIEGGRHPVVERTEDGFVPNDTHLDDDARVAVITGPNMSGKSTYMRQVALIVLLAQIGSFVPAAGADLRIVDRIFTRVGASDDIAGGRSTFMIEMTELAEILGKATERSLVLLDEVGRGTSTTDGLAIARAVTEHLHDEVGATTLFATHHHALTDAVEELDGAVNRHFSADRVDDEVAFEHDLAEGAASGSYGVDVARSAGVPEGVVRRARDLVEVNSQADRENERREAKRDRPVEPDSRTEPDPCDELREMDVATTTPLEALNTLARLKRACEDGDQSSG